MRRYETIVIMDPDLSDEQRTPVVQRVQDVINQENGYLAAFNHPVQGPVTIPGYPVHFSACNAGTWKAAPKLGEHTDEVLHQMGLSKEDIESLRNDGIIK